MNIIETQKRIDAGYDPVTVSMEKWQNLEKHWHSGNAHQSGNCALCCTYRLVDGSCTGCPLFKMGDGCITKENSSYVRALKAEDASIMLKALRRAKKWQAKQDCKEEVKEEEVEMEDPALEALEEWQRHNDLNKIVPNIDGIDYKYTIKAGMHIVTSDEVKSLLAIAKEHELELSFFVADDVLYAGFY